MTAPRKRPKAVEADSFAEEAIFTWYAACSWEHDQLSQEGLDALHDAITSTWHDWNARPPIVRAKPRRKS